MSIVARQPESAESAPATDAAGQLWLETFAAHVGERFMLETPTGEGTATLELVEAEALPAQPGMPRAEPFVLLFRGSGDTRLGQGMVRVSHPRTGPIDLFVVPVLGHGEGAYYEAVFN